MITLDLMLTSINGFTLSYPSHICWSGTNIAVSPTGCICGPSLATHQELELPIFSTAIALPCSVLPDAIGSRSWIDEKAQNCTAWLYSSLKRFYSPKIARACVCLCAFVCICEIQLIRFCLQRELMRMCVRELESQCARVCVCLLVYAH